jgi:outer membrane receptor for ferrienterochelin and colicins
MNARVWCTILGLAGGSVGGISTVTAADAPPERTMRNLMNLTLDELMNVEITSASNSPERLPEAPATVIVITREEIDRRGYTELSQILDDLPGMDVTRAYGSSYVRMSWRGCRDNVPFLVMVDGVVFNHLYFGSTETPFATVPLSNIKQVEIVYGPASAVYGADASMGVINVITNKDRPTDGSSSSARLAYGTNQTRIADVSYFFKRESLRVSLAARLDNGVLDPKAGQRYEYTKDGYYSSRRLWGGFLDNPNLGGKFSSPHRNRALDLRVFLGETELAFQYYRLDSGYGLEYAADKVQNNAIWAREERSLTLRRTDALGRKLTSSTLLRYRSSGITNDSYFVDAFYDKKAMSYVAAVSYWQANNFSWTATQDFELRPIEALQFNAGAKYEQKNLQKAYDLTGEASDPMAPGGYVPVGMLDATRYDYPPPPDDVLTAQNRITTEDLGAYLQARYGLSGLLGAADRHQLNAGLRFDHNSSYGSHTTLRGGYVGRYGRWGAKALFGQGFEEPPPRLLYGGWKGAGSDPALKAQQTETIELSGSFTAARFAALLTAYSIRNTNTLISVAGGARNLGARRVDGVELHLQTRLPVTARTIIQGWLYGTEYLRMREQKFDRMGNFTGNGDIGDLARSKLQLGLTATFDDKLSGTLRGRLIGNRIPIDTNPIRKINGYFTMDASFTARDLGVKGLGLSLDIFNVLDLHYSHPGVRSANAGDTPGYFDDAGVWHGSAGYDSSRLPQPGRAFLLSLRFDL